MTHKLIFAGTGDSLGVPRVYCDCSVCTEARETGVNKRTRCSTLLHGGSYTCWLDCGPDWRAQMEHMGLRQVTDVLITHAHNDHIGGLPDLYDYARWTAQDVKVIAPEAVLAAISTRYPWLERGLTFVPLHGKLPLGDYLVSSWEVGHGWNGRSNAYRLETPDFTFAYCPDSIRLTEAEMAPFRDLDLLVLGTAYYDEQAPSERRSLYSMLEALELLVELTPKLTVFTHLSHGVDRRTAYKLPSNVLVAHDGMELTLRR